MLLLLGLEVHSLLPSAVLLAHCSLKHASPLAVALFAGVGEVLDRPHAVLAWQRMLCLARCLQGCSLVRWSLPVLVLVRDCSPQVAAMPGRLVACPPA